MNWPTVDIVRRLAKRHKLDRCIVFSVKDGRIGYASYGRDRKTCGDTRKLADALYQKARATYGELWGP